MPTTSFRRPLAAVAVSGPTPATAGSAIVTTARTSSSRGRWR